MIDIVPDGYENSELMVGDVVKVMTSSQYNQNTESCYGLIGIIVKIDIGDEWKYKVKFSNGNVNWFKRWHLKYMDFTKEEIK